MSAQPSLFVGDAAPVRSSADLWLAVRSLMKQSVGAEPFDNWIRSLHFEAIDGATVILSAPTPFLRRRAQTLYGEAIVESVRRFAPTITAVRIRLRSIERTPPPAEAMAPEPPPAPLDPPAPALPLPELLLPFIVGDCNRLAAAAVASVAHGSDRAVLIHGGTGTGKTHLLHATVAELGAGAWLVSGREFSALWKHEQWALQAKLARLPMLLVDGLQAVSNQFAQRELADFLDRPGRRLIVSSDVPAAHMKLAPALSSRLGLSFALTDPDCEMRARLVSGAIAAEAAVVPGFALSAQVRAWIADNIVSARSLLAAVRRLSTCFAIDGGPACEVLAEQLLADLVVHHKRVIKIDDVVAAVCEVCEVSRTEMVSERRGRHIVYPRHVAMYLAKKWTGRSLPEIGRRLGGRDHTTVLHGCSSIEAKRLTNPTIAGWIAAVETKLQLGEPS